MEGRVSKSSLNTFLECERKYYYNNILKIQTPKNEIVQYGFDFHAIVEQFNKHITDEIYVDINNVADKFKQPFLQYMIIIDNYYDEDYKLFASELTVKDETKNLYGIIDIILKKDDKYIIIDLKTVVSFNEFKKEKYEREMVLYVYMLSKTQNIDISKIRTMLIRLQQNGELYDENEIIITEDLITKYLNEADILNTKIKTSKGIIEEFNMIDKSHNNFKCVYCPFLNICK